MDYLDYRERLGIGLSDIEKQKQFINRIRVFVQARTDIEFNRIQENAFAYLIGEASIIENELLNSINMDFGLNEPINLQRVWYYLEKKQNNFIDFLATIVVFANNYSGKKEYKNRILDAIKSALSDSHIKYDVLKDKDGIFIFPKGAKELDDTLISEPLEWLNDYPKSRSTFCRALKQYSDGEYARDVADNFRKALEEFLQEFLENEKNFETNKIEICKYLSEQGADANIGAMLSALLNSYKKLNDSVVKHNDKVDEKFLEFLMYQTGLFIRMIITTCK